MTPLDWLPTGNMSPTTGFLIGATALAMVALPIARRQAYQAGRRSAMLVDDRSRRERMKDRALLVAAMVPAVGFWAAVLAGSFKGLIGFGRDTLDWTDGSEYLVPATLDGVAIGFGVLAFRAVRKTRSPDRANRVVWGAALASASINFVHEASRGQEGSLLGGGYLALLSVFGVVMFHEFLDQFEDGAEAPVQRANPRFGLRWLTYFPSTLCAALAWRNHPPEDGTPATVRAALDHLEQVREAKRARREADRLARHQRRVEAERRRVELATARAQQATDHPDQQPAADADQEPTAGTDQAPAADAGRSPTTRTDRSTRPAARRKPTSRRPLRVVKPTDHSPAAIANARLLRQRYGDQLPTDRQVRNEMGWSYDRATPAIAAYLAGADRQQNEDASPDSDDQESEAVAL